MIVENIGTIETTKTLPTQALEAGQLVLLRIREMLPKTFLWRSKPEELKLEPEPKIQDIVTGPFVIDRNRTIHVKFETREGIKGLIAPVKFVSNPNIIHVDYKNPNID